MVLEDFPKGMGTLQSFPVSNRSKLLEKMQACQWPDIPLIFLEVVLYFPKFALWFIS